MKEDMKDRSQADEVKSTIGEAVREKCQQLIAMRERGELPDNCEQEYVKVLRKIDELRSADMNEMMDQMVLANEYSKFFSREKCFQLISQSRRA